MGIHLTNYRIYKENKDFDLWENKDHNISEQHCSVYSVYRWINRLQTTWR